MSKSLALYTSRFLVFLEYEEDILLNVLGEFFKCAGKERIRKVINNVSRCIITSTSLEISIWIGKPTLNPE